MTLIEKLNQYYHKQIEEFYAVFIKDKLVSLLAARLNELPSDIKVMKDKVKEHAQDIQPNQAPEMIRYHQIDLSDKYKAYIWPDAGIIEICEFNPNTTHLRAFLSFSVQKELFDNLTPIRRASIKDAELIEKFTKELREIKL